MSVPVTPPLLIGVKLNVSPEQIILVVSAIDGVGSTVTTTSNELPVQDPISGVTVYVTSCETLVVFVIVCEIVACGVFSAAASRY